MIKVERLILIAWLLTVLTACGGETATEIGETTVVATPIAIESGGEIVEATVDSMSLSPSPAAETATTVPATVTPVEAVTSANEPTVTPLSTSVPVPADIDAIIASFEGLTINEFFEESYKQLLLRDPERLTYRGLAETYGQGHGRLTDISENYLLNTQALQVGILERLLAYDRASLTRDQQLSHDIYRWYLEDQIRLHPYLYYDLPINSLSLFSRQNQLIDLLLNFHPLTNKQQAEDYVMRLANIDMKIDQLLVGLRIREDLGIIPPANIVRTARFQTESHLKQEGPDSYQIEEIELFTHFRDQVLALEELDQSEKDELIEAALGQIERSFIPAYRSLVDYLLELETKAGDEGGVGRYPDGDSYYEAMLRHETGTDLSPRQVHQLGLAEVERIRGEMLELAAAMGFTLETDGTELTLVELNQILQTESESFSGPAALAEYEVLVGEAEKLVDKAFDLRPEDGVIVKAEPAGGNLGAYYRPPALDDSREGTFFVNVNAGLIPRYRMPTIAYHEAIPGHHFQLALAQELDLPTFRRDLNFNGHVEGWGLYAEQLAWELGAYNYFPLGNLGRLQLELLRAARLVVDTGLHDLGWSVEEAAAYFEELGISQNMDRYIVLPGQASAYKIGQLKILELRQRAMDRLGENFDLKEFHNVVLGNGSMPLEILETVVDQYIADTLAANTG